MLNFWTPWPNDLPCGTCSVGISFNPAPSVHSILFIAQTLSYIRWAAIVGGKYYLMYTTQV